MSLDQAKVLEEQMRAMEFTKEACVARKHLKKRASQDHHTLKIIRSCLPEADVIRS